MARSTASKGWAAGGTVFAGVLMITMGIWHILTGIAALAQDNFFVVADNYAYELDVTAWGWLYITAGALAAIAGFFVFTGQTWARTVGIFLAAVAAIGNFLFLPYYPLWSLVMIATAIFVIWSLATWSAKDSGYTALEEEEERTSAKLEERASAKSDFSRAAGH